MRLRSDLYLFLMVFSLLAVGCTGPKVPKESRPNLIAKPILVKSASLSVTLIGIIGMGDEGTLIKDPGWYEYILEIENLSMESITVLNVKLLNLDGRYVDSASTYEQIIAPPDVSAELAGDAAKTAAGMAAGQFIPYGGQIFSVLSGAASASSAAAKENVKRVFALRVLKNVELASAGKMKGSAFLPNIKNAKALAVDYTQVGTTERIEIPLRSKGP